MGWPLVRLDSLYIIARGGSPRPIKNYITNDPNGINWVKISDGTASGKFIYKTKEKITQDGVSRSRLVKKGDFLLSNSMSFGRPYIMGTSGCIHDGWLVLSPKDGSIDPDFLYHLLSSPFIFKQFDSLAAGSTVRNLNIDLVSGVQIPVFPISEQKRIVAILDQVFADIEQARANTEQNLKNARELFESYLQQVFSQRGDGWEIKAVDEIADTCLGKMLDKEKNKGHLRPYLRNFNVQWFDISTSNLLEMRFEDDEHERYLVKKGDLLICEGGYPGRGAIWDSNEEVYFQKALHRIRCHADGLSKWILYYLYLSDRNGTLKSSFTGAGIQHFTGKSLKKLSLPVPPTDLVIGLVNKIEDIHSKVLSLELAYQSKVLEIDELKKSILQKAFSGELTKEGRAAST